MSHLKEYPRVSVYLGVAGLVVQVISAAVIYFSLTQEWPFMKSLMSDRGMATAFIIMGHSGSSASAFWLAATLILLIATLASIVLLIRGTLSPVRIGSLVLIVLAMISATTTFGLILGTVLMFASGIAGIVWTYRRTLHL